MADLLPCPFCGGEAKREDIEASDGVENAGASYITCARCWASTALHFDRKENLIDSWNRRTPPTIPGICEMEGCGNIAAALNEEGQALCADCLIGTTEFGQLIGRYLMWHMMTDKPDPGRKIIALFDDGSGAQMFLVHDQGFIDQDGDECRALSDQYDRWAYLPDDLELWFETNDDSH